MIDPWSVCVCVLYLEAYKDIIIILIKNLLLIIVLRLP